jgi:hypothetical protein
VSFGGTGLTVANPTRLSDTSFRVEVTAAIDADLGPQDVTYTQPAGGGGASGTLDDGMQVDAPAPTVTLVSPATVKQGESSVELTVTGTNFRSGGTLSIEGTGLTVGGTTVDSATSARVTISVAGGATVGSRDVTFTQPALGGGASGTGTDALAVNHPDPTFTGVTPVEVRRSDTGTFTLTGTNFRTGGTVSTDSTDVTLTSPTFVSETSFEVDYSVSAGATVGEFDLTYKQPVAGGGATSTLKTAYEIFLQGPNADTITPDAFFASGDEVSFSGTGITVHSTTFESSTELTVELSVASNAALGARDLTVTPDTGPANTTDDAVTVIPGDPTVTAFSHSSLARGASSVAVTILGTNFRSGDTVSASGTGVTFASTTIASDTKITASASVTSGAALGMRDLTVSHSAANGGRTGTLEDAFKVITASPSVTSVNPASIARTGSGGATRTVTVRIAGTNFMTGATVSVSKTSGSGVSVVSGSEELVSDTRLDVDLSITGTATTGTWNVKVTNPGTLGNSGTSGDNKLDIKSESTLTVNQVLPSSGSAHGGERVTIHGGGFLAGAVVDFGTERAYGTQVIDQNTIVTTVPAPSSPSMTEITEVDVKVSNTTGSPASRTDGYAYAKDEETFLIEKVFPADGATGVPASLVSACVLLSAPADTTSASYGTGDGATFIKWWESGGSLVSGGTSGFGPKGRWLVFSRTSGGNLSVANGGKHVLNVPGALTSIGETPLTPVQRSATDLDQSSFTVTTASSDSTGPTLSTITPTNASTGQSTTTRVTLVFNEEIDPLTVDLTNITFKSGTTIAAHIELGKDLKTVTITPETELTASTTYTTTVTAGVKDLHGNAFSSLSRTFTTGSGDTTKPTIDTVVIEDLPSTVDGSGTYVDSGGSGGNAFDAYLPQTGFKLKVTFSDEGGAGVDPSTFSAKASVKVGTTNANTELASKFTVTHTHAEWRIDETVTAGDDVTFTFSIKDGASTPNVSTSKTITIDVVDITSTASGSEGGDLDPFDDRDTWVVRGDLDAYTATFVSRTVPANEQGATTTLSSNGVNDLDESLRLVGLNSSSMTAAAAETVNGLSVGTNSIMRRLFLERLRALLRARYGIEEDGTRDDDSVEIEFLLEGEQGSLSSLPTYSTTRSGNSSKDFSEMSVGGTDGAESTPYAASSTLGRATYDTRNLDEEADINTDGTVGIFLLGMMKLEVNTYSGGPFGTTVSSKFVTVHGGTPVGEDASDDDVLAGTFDRSTSGNATHNARYDAIMDAIELIALYTSVVFAHEVGHSIGLVANGAPKTGFFGNAHEDNDFTDATSTKKNTSHHLDFAGVNDIMGATVGFGAATRTGTEAKRFNPQIIGHLLGRIVNDEGK